MSDETPTQLRDAKEAAEKLAKKLEKQLADVSGELRTMKASSAFSEAGLSGDLAQLYLAANPEAEEIDAAAAKSFAEQYGISTPAADPQTDDDETGSVDPPNTDGLENMARAGSRTGGDGQAPASTKFLTRSEFLQLQRSDPTQAQKALAEGRVRLRNDNPYASGAVPGVEDNPFASQHEASEA